MHHPQRLGRGLVEPTVLVVGAQQVLQVADRSGEPRRGGPPFGESVLADRPDGAGGGPEGLVPLGDPDPRELDERGGVRVGPGADGSRGGVARRAHRGRRSRRVRGDTGPEAWLLCLIIFLWDLAFSPFGAQRRLSNAYLLTLVIYALRATADLSRSRIVAAPAQRPAAVAATERRLRGSRLPGDLWRPIARHPLTQFAESGVVG